MGSTRIEWADAVWNPITGCSPVSAGCAHCYAKRRANRLRGRFGYPADEPFRVTFHPDRLNEPVHWRKPRRIFVCSMGDLFHTDVPQEALDATWDVMAQTPQHTFLVLTKRPGQMMSYLEDWASAFPEDKLPLPNVWLGVSAENQLTWDARVGTLRHIAAAIRFVSIEPMLRPIVADLHDIDWVICGAETGPGARPMDPDWARLLRDQCVAAGVPFFFKRGSDGSRELDGRRWEEVPGAL